MRAIHQHVVAGLLQGVKNLMAVNRTYALKEDRGIIEL